MDSSDCDVAVGTSGGRRVRPLQPLRLMQLFQLLRSLRRG